MWDIFKDSICHLQSNNKCRVLRIELLYSGWVETWNMLLSCIIYCFLIGWPFLCHIIQNIIPEGSPNSVWMVRSVFRARWFDAESGLSFPAIDVFWCKICPQWGSIKEGASTGHDEWGPFMLRNSTEDRFRAISCWKWSVNKNLLGTKISDASK